MIRTIHILIIVIVLFILVLRYALFIPVMKSLNVSRYANDIRYKSYFQHGYYIKKMYQSNDAPFKITDIYNPTPHTTNIISYSLYGNNEKYTKPLIGNIHTIRAELPSWTIRIYIHDQVDKDTYNQLKYLGVQLYTVFDPICSPGYNSAGAFWRYLPLCEKDLNVLVLDADDNIHAGLCNKIKWFFNKQKSYDIGTIWIAPWPTNHITGKWIFKRCGVDVQLLSSFIESYPFRNGFGTDEVFLTTYLSPIAKKLRWYHFSYNYLDNWYWYISKNSVKLL